MPVETATSVALPDFLPYLLAIFGLLVLWQYYQLHVMKGRILAIDIFDRSGIRMYLYAVADDSHACEVCRSAHGTVFPPSEVMKSTFSPIKGTCKSSINCIGFLVGLYGAWPEAHLIVGRLRLSRKREPIQLDQDELREVILGPWERSISANTDRLGISVLEAVLGDCANPNPAIDKYRHVVESAKEVRHMPLIVPAYFRIVELLTAQGHIAEALQLTEQFEKRYKGKQSGPSAPTEKQLGLMKIKKSQLKNTARTTAHGALEAEGRKEGVENLPDCAARSASCASPHA
jgi:hypothetical protein